MRGPHLFVIFTLTCLPQLDWLTSLPWTPTTAGSETLTRSDFLDNSKSQLDSDPYGLEKVKRRLIEYLAVVRPRALIAQEAEVEQAKAQEVTLKKAVDEPAANASETDNPTSIARPCIIPVAKPIKGQSHQSAHSTVSRSSPPSSVDHFIEHVLSFVRPPGTGKTSLGQSIARALGRPSQRIAVVCAMRLRYGVTVGLTSLADLDHLRRRCARLAVWIPFYYCEHLIRLPQFADSMIAHDSSDEMDKVGQSNYHGDPSAALLGVLDPEQNVAFNVRFLTPFSTILC